MGAIVGTLVDLGYGVAWRVLDAQYFGVAQRRRRVFIVGCAGDRARAEQVLLVGEGGGGDPPARREKGTEVAGTLGGGSGSRGWCDDLDRATFIPAVSHSLCAPSTGGSHNDHNGETLLPVPVGYRKATTSHGPDNEWERWEEAEHTNTLDAGSNVTRNAPAVVQPAYGLKEANRQANGWGIDEERAYTLDGQGRGSVAYPVAQRGRDGESTMELGEPDLHNALRAGDGGSSRHQQILTPELAVRRLTPLECLRLQGFPDDWLDGLGLADSVKYRMAGNAVAVPVVSWIASRMVAAT